MHGGAEIEHLFSKILSFIFIEITIDLFRPTLQPVALANNDKKN